MITQNDVFWVDLEQPVGFRPGYRHPQVVIQNNLLHRSRINTVIVCALTSDLRRATAPENVALDADGAGLPKRNVAVVSQVFTVDKTQLREYIGTLSKKRVRQVLRARSNEYAE